MCRSSSRCGCCASSRPAPCRAELSSSSRWMLACMPPPTATGGSTTATCAAYLFYGLPMVRVHRCARGTATCGCSPNLFSAAQRGRAGVQGARRPRRWWRGWKTDPGPPSSRASVACVVYDVVPARRVRAPSHTCIIEIHLPAPPARPRRGSLVGWMRYRGQATPGRLSSGLSCIRCRLPREDEAAKDPRRQRQDAVQQAAPLPSCGFLPRTAHARRVADAAPVGAWQVKSLFWLVQRAAAVHDDGRASLEVVNNRHQGSGRWLPVGQILTTSEWLHSLSRCMVMHSRQSLMYWRRSGRRHPVVEPHASRCGANGRAIIAVASPGRIALDTDAQGVVAAADTVRPPVDRAPAATLD